MIMIMKIIMIIIQLILIIIMIIIRIRGSVFLVLARVSNKSVLTDALTKICKSFYNILVNVRQF